MLATSNRILQGGVIFVIILALFTLYSRQVSYVDATQWGFIAELPITYWVGLLCLVVLLYLSRKSESRTVIVVGLISLYLFGIPTLIKENKAEWLPISYYRSSQSLQLLSEGHLPVIEDPFDHRNWPGFSYIVAFISSVTSVPTSVLCDNFPFFTIFLLGVAAYLILRLYLMPLYSSLGALWFLASFWTSQHYFSPQSIAYVIYFSILLLLAKFFSNKNKPGIPLPLSIIILFTATVISHLLTSIMIVAGLVAIYCAFKILPDKVKTHAFYSIATCTLLASIFFSYQFLVISQNFSSILQVLYGEISGRETHISVLLTARIVGSSSYLLELVSTYIITIINVVIGIIAILKTTLSRLLYKKGKKHDMFWIALIIAAGIFGASMKYGMFEAIERAFMFMLLPICYFSTKFLSKKPRILILVLMVLVLLHIPADYCSETYLMIPTSEMKGTAFYAKYVPPAQPYFYAFPYSGLIKHNNPNITRGYQLSLGHPPFHFVPSHEIVNQTMAEAKFIISSNLQENCYLYFLGIDPLDNLDLNNHCNRVYDNGQFCIYDNLQLSR